MSLDVYLEGPEREEPCRCQICGHEHTRKTNDTFFVSNITHNLAAMAKEAGIYEACWRPEDMEATKAGDIIHALEVGLRQLKAAPEHYSQFNAANGWGLYENFVPWVERYLEACKKHPEAIIRVSR